MAVKWRLDHWRIQASRSPDSCKSENNPPESLVKGRCVCNCLVNITVMVKLDNLPFLTNFDFVHSLHFQWRDTSRKNNNSTKNSISNKSDEYVTLLHILFDWNTEIGMILILKWNKMSPTGKVYLPLLLRCWRIL